MQPVGSFSSGRSYFIQWSIMGHVVATAVRPFSLANTGAVLLVFASDEEASACAKAVPPGVLRHTELTDRTLRVCNTSKSFCPQANFTPMVATAAGTAASCKIHLPHRSGKQPKLSSPSDGSGLLFQPAPQRTGLQVAGTGLWPVSATPLANGDAHLQAPLLAQPMDLPMEHAPGTPGYTTSLCAPCSSDAPVELQVAQASNKRTQRQTGEEEEAGEMVDSDELLNLFISHQSTNQSTKAEGSAPHPPDAHDAPPAAFQSWQQPNFTWRTTDDASGTTSAAPACTSSPHPSLPPSPKPFGSLGRGLVVDLEIGEGDVRGTLYAHGETLKANGSSAWTVVSDARLKTVCVRAGSRPPPPAP